MILKENLLERINEVLPYLEGNPLEKSRIDLLYDLANLDNSFSMLIDNLYTSTERNLTSFIAELNIIYDIIQSSPYLKNNIKYEKDSGLGTPDLKIEIDDIVIWIQLKCFSTSKLDKERNSSIQKLKDKLSEFDFFLM